MALNQVNTVFSTFLQAEIDLDFLIWPSTDKYKNIMLWFNFTLTKMWYFPFCYIHCHIHPYTRKKENTKLYHNIHVHDCICCGLILYLV